MKPCKAPEKRIFVCSRYAGEVLRNIETAKMICRMAIDAGHAPFAPHLLYTLFLNDENPTERERGIDLGLCFMDACDEVWVYTGDGISSGMQREIEHAKKLGKPVIEIREVKLWRKI